MEINEKSIQGIFLYQDSITYEKGDFVVYNSLLYVVKKKVSGVVPGSINSDYYYKIYLDDLVATEEDFYNYTQGKGEDKLMSASVLSKVLNTYLSGFDEKGIIENYITENDIYIKNFCMNEFDINQLDSYSNPLDKIMVHPELNNCIFKVSKEVVKTILGNNNNNVILRQYTYEDKDSIFIRIQELIDPILGSVKYRYSKSDELYSPKTNWKTQQVESSIRNSIDFIINYYNSKISELDNIKNNLINNFRFKLLEVIEHDTYYMVSYPKNSGFVDSITVNSYNIDKYGIRNYHSCTVNVRSLFNDDESSIINSEIKVRISKDNYFTITNTVFSDILTEVYLEIRFEQKDTKLDTVYGKQLYNNSL